MEWSGWRETVSRQLVAKTVQAHDEKAGNNGMAV